MAIRVTYGRVLDRPSTFAVAVPCGSPPQLLVIGYVSVFENEWLARRRGQTADRNIHGFKSRSEAACFLIEDGKFARRPDPVALQVAA